MRDINQDIRKMATALAAGSRPRPHGHQLRHPGTVEGSRVASPSGCGGQDPCEPTGRRLDN